MMRLKSAALKHWLLMLSVSFVLYEILWVVIDVQLEPLDFDAEDILWDFVQCILFTSAVFLVNAGFVRFRGGRYAGSIIEVVSLFGVCSLIIFLVDKVLYVQDTADDSVWDIIDIYIICIICSLLSIIDIQHSYHNRLAEMKRKQMKMRLNLLQQQLSPHFMFNSLSILQELIVADPPKAEEYVVTLSRMLRYITENLGKEKVALPVAAGYIADYARMLETRFPRHFVFTIRLDGGRPAAVIPVSMQIAVENAIRHNRHSARCPLRISITLDGEAVSVTNSKQPVSADGLGLGLGLGLDNLNERCRLLTGRELAISEDDDSYSIKIPLIYESIDRRG